jgi:ATP-dependent RNA helicase RhlE
LNNFSRRPSTGQGGQRPRSNSSNANQRFSKFKRRESPEDRLMSALGEGGAPRSSSSGRPNSSRRPQGNMGRSPQRRKSGARGQYIHPSKFINKTVKETEQVAYTPKHVFMDFPLNHRLQENIARKNYKAPSAIQDQAIPPILEGRDVIGLANTGTGKTAAFLIPAIQKLMNAPDPISVLIITPTRELATQIDDEFRVFAKDLRLYSSVCVGGMNIGRQMHSLRRRPQVVIGTPGRLRDLISQRALDLRGVHTLVLDEADRMCDMGFLPDIKQIISMVAPERQNLFFSATMTPVIASLIGEMMKDPITISVVRGVTSEHVYQDIIPAKDKMHRVDLLTDMLSNAEFEKVLVFGETKYGVQRLADALTKSGHPSEAIHGNKSQPQRQRALDKFKTNTVKVLVATDVAARGLDIPNVSHVINFDQPHTYDDYVHRIGRTGRGGETGIAYTFVDHNAI